MYRWLLTAPLLLTTVAIAEEKPPKYPVETGKFDLTITSDGQPVDGAEVHLYACRCEEDRGSHYGWPRNNTDVRTKLKSDANGKVLLEYPLKFGSPENWKTLSQISMSISHPEYVPAELHIDPREEKATKELKSGCELTFSAINSDRDPVPFAVVMAGPGRSAKWLRDDDNTVRSRGIPDGSWQTLLVSPQQDGQHLFSGVLSVRLANQQDVKIRNLKLKPGLRLVGEVDEQVPRPIEKGRVQAFCIPKPAGRAWGDEDPSVTWSEVALIEEDGTFEFPSLPRTGKIQLIAICPGWLSAEGGAQRGGSIKQGMIVDIDELDVVEDVVEDFELPMEESGTITVTVKKPDGSPLEGAQVSTNPNQMMLLSGTTILASNRRSIDAVKKQIDPDFRLTLNDRDQGLPTYSATSDKDGKATLSDIPLKLQFQVGAYHDDYILPEGGNGWRKRVPFKCDSTEPVPVLIQMKAVEKAE